MQRYEGRLELTWTNKEQSLLAGDDGNYVWLSTTDYRVAEVRLLEDVETVGDVGKRRSADNLLIEGDALHALTGLARLPEFRRDYWGKVKLAYIDPPFNTQRSFLHYDDALEHSVWLAMIRDRLVQVKNLLAPDGSIYVHCDSSESHYLKVVMDEVFGRANFRNEIIWKRTTAHSDAHTWSQVTDSIFFYTVGASFTWNPPYLEHGEEYLASKYRNVDDDGRRYRLDNLTSPNPRPNMTYEWKGFAPPAFGWRYSVETMTKLDEEGRIWYPSDKKRRPQYKRYLDESKGRLADNLWADIPPINSQAHEDSGYATQNPRSSSSASSRQAPTRATSCSTVSSAQERRLQSLTRCAAGGSALSAAPSRSKGTPSRVSPGSLTALIRAGSRRPSSGKAEVGSACFGSLPRCLKKTAAWFSSPKR